MFTRTRKKGRFTNGLSGTNIEECVNAKKKPTGIAFGMRIGTPETRIQENIRKFVEEVGSKNECTTRIMTKEELEQFERENNLRR